MSLDPDIVGYIISDTDCVRGTAGWFVVLADHIVVDGSWAKGVNCSSLEKEYDHGHPPSSPILVNGVLLLPALR